MRYYNWYISTSSSYSVTRLLQSSEERGGQKKLILTLLAHDLFSEYSDILAAPISKLLTNRWKLPNMVGVAVGLYTSFEFKVVFLLERLPPKAIGPKMS